MTKNKLRQQYLKFTYLAGQTNNKKKCDYYMRLSEDAYLRLHKSEYDSTESPVKRFYLRSKRDHSKVLADVGGLIPLRAIPFEKRNDYNVLWTSDRETMQDFLYSPQGSLCFVGIVPLFIIKNHFEIAELDA